MIRSISAAIVGSIIVFFWGFLSWTIMDWHQPREFEQAEKFRNAVATIAPKHGIYMLPGNTEDGKIDIEKREQGPFVYAVVRPGARDDLSMTRAMAGSYLTALIGSVALAAMMQMGAKSFIPRVLIGFFAGVLVGTAGALPALNWFEYPLDQAIPILADGVIAWSLAGLAMAMALSIKGKAPKEEDTK